MISVPLAWATDKALQELPEAVPIAFTRNTYFTTSDSTTCGLALLASTSTRGEGLGEV